jgi:hypothetical protein
VNVEERLMKRIVTVMSLVCCLLLGVTTVSAQPVYETKGANGPSFSDKPQPGAKAIELKPLNVIDSATLTGGTPADKSASPPAKRKTVSDKPANEKPPGDKESAVAYRSFSIVFPENDGSIVANTAVFEVRVAVDPALRLGEGHAFAVSINGRPVGQRFTATEFMIPPEFWGDQLPPANQRQQLAAAIIDRNGVVLKEAAPVQFQLRYATVQPRPYTPQPQPKPLPATTRGSQGKIGEKPLPDSKPALER